MSSWKKAAKANQKTHKERHQPESRKHLGLLEKKKDYKKRADDYHKKGDTLKLIRKRALDKNPDEFYFHMINSKVKDGSNLHMTDLADSTPNTHVFFVDEDEEKNFDIAKRLDTHPALINRKSNRPRLSDLHKLNLPATLDFASNIKEKSYKELSKRIEREKLLTVVQQKMELKRHLNDARIMKPKKIQCGTAVSAPVYKFQYIRKK
ncbi:unnamed protein product [Leptidea sinapis]|uniref:Probable U3 small nucleolar RNA-associated protein 11 n=1 Tax=Leptidea sinapis TaxID=189913 RepID=A0A5E4Q0E5_9NEOP|nr:unnamed protein product [Leptidea sinapis]